VPAVSAGAGVRVAQGLIHLASASPRRQELLAAAQIPFKLVTPGPEEDVDTRGLLPHQEALRKACHKARFADPGLRAGVILAADTVVALGPRALNKAADAETAAAMLADLSGREHEVFTAVALVARPAGIEVTGVDCARVRFRALTPYEIQAYVDTGEWRDRAGAYAAQGRAARLIARVDGDLETVVGLPTTLVRTLLRELEERS
jgi:septum formation protein